MTIDTIERETDTIQGTAVTDGTGLIEAGDVQITHAEILDVDLFLASDRGSAWLKRHTDGAYFTAWYDYNRSPHELKWCNELAVEILDMKQAGKCPGEIHDHIAGKFSGGQSAEEVYEEEHEADVTRAISDISEALDELREEDPAIPELDTEEWEQEVKDRIVQHMYDDDDSSVSDLFDKHDRCELIIELGDSEHVASQKAWAEFDSLVVDESLQRALYAMGYTVSDYRRMSGNRDPGHNLKRGLRKRAQPLLSEAELRELVSEACTTHWQFVLYAMVPVYDLVDLDLTAPISLSNYAIASYNGGSGTFYDIIRKQALTLMPGEGRLTGTGRYGPDDVCGLYRPPYQADIANLEA